MDKLQLNLTIDALLEKRKKIENEISLIDGAIESLRSQLNGNHKEVPVTKTSVNENDTHNGSFFPATESLEAQVLAALDLSRKPLKVSQISEIIKDKTGKEFDISKTIHSLYDEKKLILMKINNSNRLSYWLKRSWYDKSLGAIKPEYELDNMYVLYRKENIKYME